MPQILKIFAKGIFMKNPSKSKSHPKQKSKVHRFPESADDQQGKMAKGDALKSGQFMCLIKAVLFRLMGHNCV